MTSKLTGEVVRAGDPGYEAARIGWNRLYSRYPEAIVFCCDAHEVANAVEWAREEGIALRARSGLQRDGIHSTDCSQAILQRFTCWVGTARILIALMITGRFLPVS